LKQASSQGSGQSLTRAELRQFGLCGFSGDPAKPDRLSEQIRQDRRHIVVGQILRPKHSESTLARPRLSSRSLTLLEAISRVATWRVVNPDDRACFDSWNDIEMKIAGFTGELTANRQISVPPEIAATVPPGKRLQVTIFVGFA